MGVPTFFKWLSVKYPKVLDDAIETRDNLNEDGDWVPLDPSTMMEPNPNGEFDNLYLDMNGIIHPCCHPEGCAAPANETEMFEAIFAYIDRLMLIVRPRKLLYMAIDGVAPRAKMNQQRSRRFKAAAEAEEAEQLWEELRVEAEKDGRAVPAKPSHWDSNVITPGTPFFARLAKALRWYIVRRQKDHPGWKGLTVLLSDASVPGEGEHKVMAFIRAQRTLEGYNPNTRHCLCGADADLIMLGLATHEVSFTIIRETVVDKEDSKRTPCVLCGTVGHMPADCPTASSLNAAGSSCFTVSSVEQQKRNWKPLAFLRLSILREYLQEEFSFRDYLGSHGIALPQPSDPNWKAHLDSLRAKYPHVFLPDLERCVDDFILMCFFVGNDFLPHLPSLSIHKGSIDQMILLYQKIRPRLPDYLCDSGEINIASVKSFTLQLGLVEGQVFRAEQRRLNAMKRREAQQEESEEIITTTDTPAPDANFAALEKLRATLFPNEETTAGETDFDETSEESADPPSVLLRTHAEQIDFFKERLRERQKALNETKGEEDRIRLGEGNERDWRRRYYVIKFKEHLDESAEVEDVNRFAAVVARKYAEGLAWVLKYYFQGVCSWSWYFPYYYAPLASDLASFGFNEDFYSTFTLGDPFKPFHQLMAVLPARSRHCLPECLQRLMIDQNSPIIDFYPTKFEEDPDGKRFKWQWVVKLPFIDENRLLPIVDAALEGEATEEEKSRNTMGVDQLYLSSESVVVHKLKQLHLDEPLLLNCSDGITLGGEVVRTSSDLTLGVTVTGTDQFFDTVEQSNTLSVRYVVKPRSKHISTLLLNAIIPAPHLSSTDMLPEDTNSRRFNSGPAKRIIIASLGKQGIIAKEEVDKYFTQNNNRNQGFHDIHNIGRDNRYETEMFGQRSNNSTYQPDHSNSRRVENRHRRRESDSDRFNNKRPRQYSADHVYDRRNQRGGRHTDYNYQPPRDTTGYHYPPQRPYGGPPRNRPPPQYVNNAYNNPVPISYYNEHPGAVNLRPDPRFQQVMPPYNRRRSPRRSHPSEHRTPPTPKQPGFRGGPRIVEIFNRKADPWNGGFNK